MKAYVVAAIVCGSVSAVAMVWYFGGRKQNISRNNVHVPDPDPPDVERAVVTSTSARRDWGIRGWGGGGMSSWGGGAIGVGARI